MTSVAVAGVVKGRRVLAGGVTGRGGEDSMSWLEGGGCNEWAGMAIHLYSAVG